MAECTMGFCGAAGVERVQAFDLEEPVWWCKDHADLARANRDAHGEDDHE